MTKIYLVLPIGQHPFNNEYIVTRSREKFESLEKAEETAKILAKNYQGTIFIVFESVKQVETIFKIS